MNKFISAIPSNKKFNKNYIKNTRSKKIHKINTNIKSKDQNEFL